MYLHNNFYCFKNINIEALSKSSHNRIHTYSGCFGATDDLATTFLYLSLLLHFVRLSLSPSYSVASVEVKFDILLMNKTGAHH